MKEKLETKLNQKKAELEKLATEIDNVNRAIQRAQSEQAGRVAEAQKMQGSIEEIQNLIDVVRLEEREKADAEHVEKCVTS